MWVRASRFVLAFCTRAAGVGRKLDFRHVLNDALYGSCFVEFARAWQRKKRRVYAHIDVNAYECAPDKASGLGCNNIKHGTHYTDSQSV